LLRDSPALGSWGWDQAIALARQNVGADPHGYHAEAVALMRTARDLDRAQ
jgi:Ca-activated chloride channel homolog